MDARLRAVVALLVGPGLLAGCSSRSGGGVTDGAARAVVAGDPAYAMDQLLHRYGELGGAPADLEGALPNHHYRVGRHPKLVCYSDALVIGRVTSVGTGVGVVWRGENDYTVVSFDDSSASTRTAVVTMTVDDATGAIGSANRAMSFRVSVPSAADPEKFVESLAGLGRIAVVLDRDARPYESTPWRPLMNDSLIAVIGQRGSLTLPGLAGGRVFAGDLQSEAALFEAARAPDTTTALDIP